MDNRSLSGTGNSNYDLTMVPIDFDLEEDYKEVVKAEKDKSELSDIVKNYKKALSGAI